MRAISILALALVICGCSSYPHLEPFVFDGKIGSGISSQVKEPVIAGKTLDDLSSNDWLSTTFVTPNKVAVMGRLRTGDVECFLLDLNKNHREYMATYSKEIFPTISDWQVACAHLNNQDSQQNLILVSYTLENENGSLRYDEDSTFLEVFLLEDVGILKSASIQIGTKDVAHPTEKDLEVNGGANRRYLYEAADGGAAKMEYSKIILADVNGDNFSDIIIVTWTYKSRIINSRTSSNYKLADTNVEVMIFDSNKQVFLPPKKMSKKDYALVLQRSIADEFPNWPANAFTDP
jgi:hypothetical protein